MGLANSNAPSSAGKNMTYFHTQYKTLSFCHGFRCKALSMRVLTCLWHDRMNMKLVEDKLIRFGRLMGMPCGCPSSEPSIWSALVQRQILLVFLFDERGFFAAKLAWIRVVPSKGNRQTGRFGAGASSPSHGCWICCRNSVQARVTSSKFPPVVSSQATTQF